MKTLLISLFLAFSFCSFGQVATNLNNVVTASGDYLKVNEYVPFEIQDVVQVSDTLIVLRNWCGDYDTNTVKSIPVYKDGNSYVFVDGTKIFCLRVK